jgi:Ring finger domain
MKRTLDAGLLALNAGSLVALCWYAAGPESGVNNCQSTAGFCGVFQLVMGLVLVRELIAPLGARTANFSCQCSWTSLVAVLGVYIVGILVWSHPWAPPSCFPEAFGWFLLGQSVLDEVYLVLLLAFAWPVLTVLFQQDYARFDALANPHSAPRGGTGGTPVRPGLAPPQLGQIRVIVVQPSATAGPLWPAHGGEGAPAPLAPRPPTPSAPPLPALDAGRELELAACSICLQPCCGLVKRLACGHSFHADCIDRWLAQVNSCALCRRPAI